MNIPHLQTNTEIKALITQVVPAVNGALVAAHDSTENVLTFVPYRQSTIEIATYIKLSTLFQQNNPIDCHVIDNIADKFRFTVIYNVQSLALNTRTQVVTKCNDLLPLVSLQGIYPAFNWAEREIWDLSGVFFIKHPDLRRILTDYGFIGHPLRKDFPLSGFREVHYEDSTKHIEYDNLELSQNYRVSNLLNPWASEKAI